MGWDLPIDGLPSPATSPGRKYLESDYKMNNSFLCEPECEAPEPHAGYHTNTDSRQAPIDTPVEFRYVNVTNPRQTSIETGTFTVNTPSVPYITESIIDDQELEGPAVWQKKQHIGIHSNCGSDDDLSLKKPDQPKMIKPDYTYQALSSNLPKIPTDEELNTLIATETHKINLPKKRPVSNFAKTVEKKAQLAPKSGVGRDVIMRKLGALLTDTPGDVPVYSMDDKTLVALTEQALMGFSDSLYKW